MNFVYMILSGISHLFVRFCWPVIGASILFVAACSNYPPGSQKPEEVYANAPAVVSDLATHCQPEFLQAVASGLDTKVTVKSISNGPRFIEGAQYFPASGEVPPFCQVTGSFETNPETGKTANFLATFPATWNGKYLQLGCSGHCGQFAVSDVAQPFATIPAQGYPHDPIKRGYAVFATDEGHEGMSGGTWAIKPDGQVDEEAITDFFQRATRVLSVMGKAFTRAFYDTATGDRFAIDYSYFNGCSGGGRDALVAASYYPDAFDGIIAGSPYTGPATSMQMVAVPLASIRSDAAEVPANLIAGIDALVKAKCDELDGAKDGLIQNPAACDFRPEVDLPRCSSGKSDSFCFSNAQIETISVALSAITDENGNIVQPGFSISEIQPATFVTPPRPVDLSADDPFPNSDNGSVQGGYWPLGDAMLKVLVNKNRPDFYSRSLVSFTRGGKGPVTAYRAIVPEAQVAYTQKQAKTGVGNYPENYRNFFRQDKKLLMWHNLSDQTLTPYTSINLYNEMADQYGGYQQLQDNARLFLLPGTGHCSMVGVGPNTFDALGALENWVERGNAPNELIAEQYPNNMIGMKDFSVPPERTMPLCKFPEMARYSGKGNVNNAENWSCPAGDTGMLEIGESGRQAGVMQ